MAHDVFVSHSAKDKATADAVCAVLESHGIRCWVAPRDILPGQDWGGSIIKAINGARAMVLVFSANANTSRQIKLEVERAVNKGIPVIPLRIEDVAPTETLEYFISTPHWLDAFTPPLERHLEYLAEVARKIVGGPEVNSAAVAEREAREKAEAEAARGAEEKRKTAELAALKLAEEKKIAEALEAAGSAEEKRKAVETAEAMRLVEERRKVEEEARVAEEKRKAVKDADYSQLLQIKETSEGRKAAEAAPHRLRQTLRKILGSFLSTCVGWLIAALVASVIVSQRIESGFWRNLPFSIIALGYVVLPVWLLVLLPLYLLVPRTSKLWRTPICTAIGAASGPLITLGFVFALWLYTKAVSGELLIFQGTYVAWAEVSGKSVEILSTLDVTALEVVFGGVTCCLAAATAHYFRGARTVKTNHDRAIEAAETRRVQSAEADRIGRAMPKWLETIKNIILAHLKR
jgi:hypothetical protein